ncbi:hypothetical protein C1637_05350 [Chryseobacterium lactis]|uniref:Lantibiotic dehydratase n=1 Tax=Chryseobacterium lactis TaxID=1241981 RepID=A0A3G6RN91_CHRLC|nr:lantibiotic dehydratase [Chryseobacterium lactis]AZA84271.1 hypothetical protein EG342_21320 [Chryseobacterium lactis]AZB04659.1 hypothetical protein EG341_12200 [Chryseobacterium lactis]PNW14390.1 hypothetical protein C1637_05350 [Chryseobacterium lactis]
MKISFFNTAFIRTPLFQLEKYNDVPDSHTNLYDFIKNLWNNVQFRDALYVASSELYAEWEKIIFFKRLPEKEEKKIGLSLLKYYIRSVSRSTPFGLFSAYSLAKINAEEECSDQEYKRYTTLDLSIVFKIVRLLNSLPSVQNILKYTPNYSLYKSGNGYRYIEIKLNGKREHVLTSLEEDEVLNILFPFCATPRSVREIAAFIDENVEDVTEEDIQMYISGLIDSQVIVSNLDVCINETHPLLQIFNFLEDHNTELQYDAKFEEIYNNLSAMLAGFRKLDEQVFSDTTKIYNSVYENIDQIIQTQYDKKQVINSNLKVASPVKPSNEDLKKIRKAINIFSHLTQNAENTGSKQNLEKFKETFYKRYEDKAIPLTTALDNETGIGYKQDNNVFSTFSDLIDDIEWNFAASSTNNLTYQNQLHNFWRTKLIEASRYKDKALDLENIDLSAFSETKVENLPASFSAMYNKAGDKIIIESIGNNSAINLIGRFSNLDKEVEELASEIVQYENADDNILHCELLHVQDDRVGNILARNVKRSYEVSFLTTGSENTEQISLDDIYIKVWNNRIILFSKKHNKEIKIYNSTAHNYNYNALPIYEFLCDFQHQDHSSYLFMNFGKANNAVFKFFPRVTCGEDLILSAATWKISIDDISGSYDSLLEHLNDHKVPRYFYLVQGDNTFLIDQNNDLLTSILFEELKKHKNVYVKECIYDIEKDNYANEIILSLKNEDFKINSSLHRITDDATREKFIPGDEWLYYKIYTGVKIADEILISCLKPLAQDLINRKLIKEWFFIRYNDPDFHIRFRMKITSAEEVGSIIASFNLNIRNYIENGSIWKVELSTYDRELERYGYNMIDHAEKIFYYDSELVTDILESHSEKQDVGLWMIACQTINQYLDAFEFSDDEKLSVLESLAARFNDEFNVDKNIKKQMDRKFRDHQNLLSSIIERSDYHDITENRFLKIKKICKHLSPRKREFIDSIIHMHVNRYIKANARAHELLIYNILHKFYKERIGKMKFNKV